MTRLSFRRSLDDCSPARRGLPAAGARRLRRSEPEAARGRLGRRRQVPVRPRHRVARARRTGSTRASTSSSSSTPIRRAPTARTPSWASATRTSARSRIDSLILARQRVPGVPDVLPAEPARRLRAVPDLALAAVEADARAAARPDRHARRAARDARRSCRTTRTAPTGPRCEKLHRAGARSAVRVRVPGRAVLLPARAGMPARSRGFRALLKDDPGVHAAATRSTSTWARRSTRAGRRRRSAAATTTKLVKEFPKSKYVAEAPRRGWRRRAQALTRSRSPRRPRLEREHGPGGGGAGRRQHAR